jgi:hypothetical protein
MALYEGYFIFLCLRNYKLWESRLAKPSEETKDRPADRRGKRH